MNTMRTLGFGLAIALAGGSYLATAQQPPAQPPQPMSFFIPVYSNYPLLPVAEQPSQAAIVGGWFWGCCIIWECGSWPPRP